jgi:hypothetical protein
MLETMPRSLQHFGVMAKIAGCDHAFSRGHPAAGLSSKVPSDVRRFLPHLNRIAFSNLRIWSGAAQNELWTAQPLCDEIRGWGRII